MVDSKSGDSYKIVVLGEGKSVFQSL